MKRRTLVRIISFSLSGVIIAFGIATLGWWQAFGYRQIMENGYQRAFFELCSSISGIDFALQKGLYSNSPVMLASLSSEIFRESASASNALAELPFSDLRLNQTAKFISQVGDYSYALSKRAAGRDSLTDEDRKTLIKLSDIATGLNQGLEQLSNEIHDRSLRFNEIIKAEKQLDEAEENNKTDGIAGTFLNLEQELKEFPTLIYDGPFSEHILRKKPAFLEGRSEISVEYARQVASKFLKIPVEQIATDGETADNRIPAYSFKTNRDNDILNIDVTKVGGIVLSLIDSCEAEKSNITTEQAINKAKAFLAEQGYGEMRPSYHTSHYNRIEINFAAVSGDILLYTDLIQVGVSLDNGNICNFKAYGYIMNHKPRTIPFFKVSAQEARQSVAPGLTVLSQNLALIPTAGEREYVTHELKCRAQNGTTVLVYIDVETGDEVSIMLLREDENGTLAV